MRKLFTMYGNVAAFALMLIAAYVAFHLDNYVLGALVAGLGIAFATFIDSMDFHWEHKEDADK